MKRDIKAELKEILRDPMRYIPAFIKIRNKKGQVVPLEPNPA